MKRKITKILTLILAVMTFSLLLTFSSSAAKEYVSGDFRFRVGSKSATLVEYTGSAKEVKIPSKVQGKPVMVIDKEAFWGKTKMKSVTIPSTVIKIGQAAFNECTGLTKVSLPTKLKTISSGAFWYCTNLKKIYIYDKVTTIGENAFRGCNNLTVYVVKGSFAEKHVKTLSNVKIAYRYVTSLKLDKTSLSLDLGSSGKLTCTVSPKNVHNSAVSYKSSNPKIVKVSSDGTVTAVSCGTATITVTAKDKSGKTAKCTVKVLPGKISNLKVSAQTKDSYKLSWSKVSGATGYRIIKYNTDTKKWEKVLNTTKTSYTFKNLEAGSAVRYGVKAYTKVNKTVYYAASYAYVTAKTLSPDKVTGLKASAKSNSVSLSWTAIDGADGYCVYIFDEEINAYYKMATVSSSKAEVERLQSNQTYSFAVKAFFKTDSSITYSKYYSDALKVTTLPGVVQGFCYLEDSLSYNKVTLSWTKLNQCSGYIIYLYNIETDKYEVLKKIKGNETVSFEVTDLEEKTPYHFKIRAYASLETNLGDATEKLTVVTKEKGIDKENAIALFTEALNNTKNSNASFSMLKECHILDLNAPNQLEYTTVLRDVAREYSTVYTIVNGADKKTGVSLNSLIAPSGKNSALTNEHIKADSLVCYNDGEGFFISFDLPTEAKEAVATSLVTDPVNWAKVEENHETFRLNSCVYLGTRVKSAKIVDGKISYLITEMPIKANFTLGAKTYEFTETVEYRYFFTWN